MHYRTALISWFIAALFYGYEFLHRIAPSVMAPFLMVTFETSAKELGSLSATYFYAYAFSQIPSGILLDRFGPRKVLTVASLLITIGSLLFAHATTLFDAKVARIFIGIGSAPAFTGCLLIASTHLPKRSFPMIVGLTNTIGILGAIIAEYPLTVLLEWMNWRDTVQILSIFGIVLTLLLFIFVRTNHISQIQRIPHIRTAIHNPQLWIISIVAALRVVPIISFGELWAIPYLEQGCCIPPRQASTALSFIFIGIGIGGPLIPFLTFYIRAKWLIILGAVGALISYQNIIYHQTFLSVLISFFFLGFMTSSMLLCFDLIKRIHQKEIRGFAIALTNTLVTLSGAIFQPIIGLLLDNQWEGLFMDGIRVFTLVQYQHALLIVPLCLIVSILLSLFIRKVDIYRAELL